LYSVAPHINLHVSHAAFNKSGQIGILIPQEIARGVSWPSWRMTEREMRLTRERMIGLTINVIVGDASVPYEIGYQQHFIVKIYQQAW
jgi:hypothetical protein